MNAYEKLLAVQQELKAPKGQFNNFGKYKYRSCEDILEAVKPILGKYKSVLTISDHIELIGDRHYVIATVNFVDTESGDIIPATAQAREEESKKGMDSSQVTGAASSYAGTGPRGREQERDGQFPGNRRGQFLRQKVRPERPVLHRRHQGQRHDQ